MNSNKGVSLIIVIFAMMLFAVLGWTLAVMQSTDFEANLRTLDSERALGLAEAGANWALRQLATDSSWRTDPTNPDDVCDNNNSEDWRIHSLSPGQYRLCCRNTVLGVEEGNVAIESEGYIPAYTDDYRAMREVRLVVRVGSFTYALQAHNLFDWSAMHGGSSIDGDIQVYYYDRDGDCNPDTGEGCNELGTDYRPPPLLPGDPDPLPPDGKGDDRIIAAEPYPLIDMAAYEAMAGSRVWPQNWLASEAVITGITPRPGNLIDVEVNQNIFTNPPSQWNNEIVRNISGGRGWSDADWRIISQRINSQTVRITNDGLNWVVGEQIRIGKRYENVNVNNQTLWYIKGDVMFQATAGGGVRFQRTGLVAEGDIVLKGIETIDFSDRPEQCPNLATQNGNVISLDTPDGGSDSAKRNRRSFDGLIYTQNGDITFNYIKGTSVMGNNITFLGSIYLEYESDIEEITGFLASISEINWQEQ